MSGPLEGDYTCVYLAQFGNMVKVGITNNPWARLRTLQTGLPERLSMPYLAFLPRREMAATVETRVHRKLAHRRALGEWFRIDLEEAIEVTERTIRLMIPRHLRNRETRMSIEEAILRAEDRDSQMPPITASAG